MKNILKLSIFLILTFIFTSCNARNTISKDKKILNKYSRKINNMDDKRLINIMSLFINTPYLASTLEINNNEKLVINLRQLDCLTFVENSCALYKCNKENNFSFENFSKNIQNIRYRDGIINGYLSRLHYSSDWIINNIKKGYIRNITPDISDSAFYPNVYFMSQNSQYYKALKTYKEIEKIKNIEKKINKHNLHYIPKKEINKYENRIKDGDIIFICTNIKGLDITHVGFAIHQNGELHLLHASSVHKKVIISNKTLKDYLMDIKKDTGIIVCRLI